MRKIASGACVGTTPVVVRNPPWLSEDTPSIRQLLNPLRLNKSQKFFLKHEQSGVCNTINIQQTIKMIEFMLANGSMESVELYLPGGSVHVGII